MTVEQEKQLKLEIDHIFQSGASEIRIFNMVKRFLDKNEEKPSATNSGLFKIKHKPSGLFYQVRRHMGSNLSKTGKIYSKIGHAKSAYNPEKEGAFRIVLSYSSPLVKILEDLGYKFEKRTGYYGQQTVLTPASEWEIVEI